MAPRDEFVNCPLFQEHNQLLRRDEVDAIVRRTVKETLTSMGIDSADPMEMQRDFQTLRDWRRASNAVRSKALMVIIGILVSGALGALWIGVKSVLHK